MDDLSYPIRFDIAENDYKFGEMFIANDSNWRFADKMESFYDLQFDIMDNLIISGSDKNNEIHGPLIVDSLDNGNSEGE